MKNISIRIANNGSNIKFDLEVSPSKSMQVVQRALVYQFFDYYDTMRRIKAAGFKATEPFNVSMVIDGVQLWDTAVDCSVEAQARLKLINTPKGRGNFEYNLTELIALTVRLKVAGNDTKAIIKSVNERLMTAK